jgi:hypothetical protein
VCSFLGAPVLSHTTRPPSTRIGLALECAETTPVIEKPPIVSIGWRKAARHCGTRFKPAHSRI